MFSPYYAWRGHRDPLDHCAVNVALYGPGARWAMTERGKAAVARSESALQIGPSSLAWEGETLKIELNEIGAPLPKRIRGSIRVTPTGFTRRSFALDAAGHHTWHPIAPRARIEVRLENPALRWRGTAYLDSNFGAEPLVDGFSQWSWSRAHRKNDSVILYDAQRRDGSHASLALRVMPDGAMESLAPPPITHLKPTGWRMARPTRADAGQPIKIERTLEDTPFYARSLLRAQLYGEQAEIFHESLSLDRLRSPIVRAMLPFRMPRRIF